MKSILVSNWKLYLSPEQSREHAANVLKVVRQTRGIDIVVCPAAPALSMVSDVLKRSSIAIGAQNVDLPDGQAATGEISAADLRRIGCSYALVGHSERRAKGELDAEVRKKIIAILANGMTPILCVGETWAEFQAGKAKSHVRRQIRIALRGVADISIVIVAYEPVWAISGHAKARKCTPEYAGKMQKMLRGILPHNRLLYGGSVTAQDCKKFLDAGYNGALIGRASANSREYATILHNVSKRY